ncbi:hypothetical protein [Streptomyces demainii]|uniref:Peptidoglycan-binding protein n=1 Tax=Streptomyces demainii TaxID=588122 RepID=A0ABT9KSY3_9ACTN|nr:hypothetical protein [Streptomyces demainii]MDP9611549.1 hypothetical protein [Streptomyces demainii]
MTITGKGDPSSDELEILKKYFGSGSGGKSSGGGRVFMGTTWDTSGPHGGSGAVAPDKKPTNIWVSEEEAMNDFYNWSNKQQRDFLAKGIIGGQLKLGDGPVEAGKFWSKLVKEAAKYGAAGKKVSPLDILAAYVGSSGGKSAWVRQGDFEINSVTGEKRYVGPRFKTETQSRVDLTDPDTARAMATKLFQDMMGRDPGAGELTAFGRALNEAERSSPVVQTTTTEYDMKTGESIGANTTSSGGLTADARAYIGEQQIKKKKEYGVNQAVTTYQNALENLIYGAPDGTG